MATDYGTDISCYPDLDAAFGMVSGFTLVAQDLSRRLETPRGGLFYDSNYGTDVRAWCNGSGTPAEIGALRAAIENECRKDDRVLDIVATVTFSAPTSSLAIKLLVTLKDGTFGLVLAVSSVTLSILQVG